MLLLARTIKNRFAPISRVPPDVLSLIPDYCETDRELIRMTHTCRYWREILVSRASLWTFLTCQDLDKTSVYIQRSRGSPLEVRIDQENREILLLVIAHVGRLKALTIRFSGWARDLPRLLKYLGSTAPLLQKLRVHVQGKGTSNSDSTLFENTLLDGNLSLLRELCLSGLHSNLPWRNMSNLLHFDFRRAGAKTSTNQLLDFFERAPLLREIQLSRALPNSSTAPAKRVVSLPHLALLKIHDQTHHSTILNHLHIPTGALVMLEFEFGDQSFPVPDYLPESLDNFRNVSHITSVNLDFDVGPAMRLNGPSGGLHMAGSSGFFPPMLEEQTLRLINWFPISTTKSLTVSLYRVSADPNTEESAAYQLLLPMKDLRTLTLMNCTNLSFILALNPNHNTSNEVLCPKLEELVLYIQVRRGESLADELLEMAKARASRGARLSAIVIVCWWGFTVPGLENYTARLEYSDVETPSWDSVPSEADVFGWDSF